MPNSNDKSKGYLNDIETLQNTIINKVQETEQNNAMSNDTKEVIKQCLIKAFFLGVISTNDIIAKQAAQNALKID